MRRRNVRTAFAYDADFEAVGFERTRPAHDRSE
jgi:hypothetical protein